MVAYSTSIGIRMLYTVYSLQSIYEYVQYIKIAIGNWSRLIKTKQSTLVPHHLHKYQYLLKCTSIVPTDWNIVTELTLAYLISARVLYIYSILVRIPILLYAWYSTVFFYHVQYRITTNTRTCCVNAWIALCTLYSLHSIRLTRDSLKIISKLTIFFVQVTWSWTTVFYAIKVCI